MKKLAQQPPVVAFEQIVMRGCGLDVHEKTVVATIDGEGIVSETRTFDTYTSSLTDYAIGYNHISLPI
jgi:transposase